MAAVDILIAVIPVVLAAAFIAVAVDRALKGKSVAETVPLAIVLLVAIMVITGVAGGQDDGGDGWEFSDGTLTISSSPAESASYPWDSLDVAKLIVGDGVTLPSGSLSPLTSLRSAEIGEDVSGLSASGLDFLDPWGEGSDAAGLYVAGDGDLWLSDPSLLTYSGSSVTGLSEAGLTALTIVLPKENGGIALTEVAPATDPDEEETDPEAPDYMRAGVFSTLLAEPDSGYSLIGGYAFASCNALEYAVLPDSLTSIGDNAFQECTGLTSVDFPASLESIGYRAFAYIGGSLTSVDFPASLTSIGSSAFQGCTGLTSVDFPASLTSIGSSAFSGCTGLTSLDLGFPASLESIIEEGNSIFYNCSGLTSLDLPDSLATIGRRMFGGCSGLTSLDLPDSLESIGNIAFQGCTGLTSLDLPDSLTSIGENGFSYCTGLTSVSFPDSLTSIGRNAFSGCTGLTSLDLPDSLERIGSSAFQGCTGLASVDFPASLISIASNVFMGCTGITQATFAAGFSSNLSTDWAPWRFYDSDGSTSIPYTDASALAGHTFVGTASALVKVAEGQNELTAAQLDAVQRLTEATPLADLDALRLAETEAARLAELEAGGRIDLDDPAVPADII